MKEIKKGKGREGKGKGREERGRERKGKVRRGREGRNCGNMRKIFYLRHVNAVEFT